MHMNMQFQIAVHSYRSESSLGTFRDGFFLCFRFELAWLLVSLDEDESRRDEDVPAAAARSSRSSLSNCSVIISMVSRDLTRSAILLQQTTTRATAILHNKW
jgi:hypothetical protein